MRSRFLPGVLLVLASCKGGDSSTADANARDAMEDAAGSGSSVSATINTTISFDPTTVTVERRPPMGHIWLIGHEGDRTLALEDVHFDGASTDYGWGVDISYSEIGVGEWQAECFFLEDFVQSSEGWSGSFSCELEPQGSTPPPAVTADVSATVLFSEIPSYPAQIADLRRALTV